MCVFVCMCVFIYIYIYIYIYGSFEIESWSRMEMISWADRVRNEAVLHMVKEERNIL